MLIDYLKYFVDVAQCGSISKAASENFISSQGMSRSLSVFENEIGYKLFTRLPNKIVLNNHGQKILPYACDILQTYNDMMNCITSIREGEQNFQSKAITMYLNSIAFGAAFFEPVMENFDEVFHKVEYIQCENEDIAKSLINNTSSNINIGLLCLFSTHREQNAKLLSDLENCGFKWQPYLRSFDEILVSAYSDLAKKKLLSRADVSSYSLVINNGDIFQTVASYFGNDLVKAIVNDNESRFKLVANSKAFTVIPAYFKLLNAFDAARDNHLVPVPMKNPYSLEIGFVAHEEAFNLPFVKMLLSRLNSFYLSYASSPCLTLIRSDLTAFRDKMPVNK